MSNNEEYIKKLEAENLELNKIVISYKEKYGEINEEKIKNLSDVAYGTNSKSITDGFVATNANFIMDSKSFNTVTINPCILDDFNKPLFDKINDLEKSIETLKQKTPKENLFIKKIKNLFRRTT